MPPRDLVAIMGINIFARKNSYQTRAMAAFGYRFDVLSTQREIHDVGCDANAAVIPLRAGFLARSWQVLGYLLRNRRRLHHVEVYVGGRFCAMYALLARLVGVPVLIVERGDLFMYMDKTYGLTTRLSMRLAYHLGKAIWYRELYAEAELRRMGFRRLYLLANSVPVPPNRPDAARDIDILWVNRFKPPRRAKFAADALAKVLPTHSAQVHVFGITENDTPEVLQIQDDFKSRVNGLPGLTLHEFADPHDWYCRSRYFLLPADVTFANFALLEAMAAGVVPIISDVPGSELLVKDGESGFIVEHSAEGFRLGLERALALDWEGWCQMSISAYKFTRERYSIETWRKSLFEIYATL